MLNTCVITECTSMLSKIRGDRHFLLTSARPLKKGFGKESNGVYHLQYDSSSGPVAVMLKSYTSSRTPPREVSVYQRIPPTCSHHDFSFPMYYGTIHRNNSFFLCTSLINTLHNGRPKKEARSIALAALANKTFCPHWSTFVNFIRKNPAKAPRRRLSQRGATRFFCDSSIQVSSRMERNAHEATRIFSRINWRATVHTISHGDAQIPNILIDEFGIPAFIDLGSVGLRPFGYDLARLVYSRSIQRLNSATLFATLHSTLNAFSSVTTHRRLQATDYSPNPLIYLGVFLGFFDLVERKMHRAYTIHLDHTNQDQEQAHSSIRKHVSDSDILLDFLVAFSGKFDVTHIGGSEI